MLSQESFTISSTVLSTSKIIYKNTQLSGEIFDTYNIPNLNILYVPISEINKVMIMLYTKQILYSQKFKTY